MLALGSGSALAEPQSGADMADRSAVSRVDDGSFEYPAAPANSFRTVLAGQPIGPWKVTRGAVDLIGAGFWQAAQGKQSVDLNATRPGTVAQTFSTKPFTKYTVTYSLAANPGGQAVKTGRVLVDGRNVQNFSFDSTGKTRANMGYRTRQVTFLALGFTTTLAFESTIAGAYGPVIDDVRVDRTCHR
ncbi:choice-of-anchor C family protein [Streptomyces sp. KN37]|uniref:choice-of-anchor C family protein n=1 Tax=unclassified Streptomyces TaxID=2593676 RepID=UPI002A74EB34|nr:choice-of-anchor C family protein [Streptomyces sp. KN37]WPO76796.1 choice-of-anchor C family protein [Streptomyces sp. KN37]